LTSWDEFGLFTYLFVFKNKTENIAKTVRLRRQKHGNRNSFSVDDFGKASIYMAGCRTDTGSHGFSTRGKKLLGY